MNQELALRTISKLMNWDMERARKEDAWLRLISRIKYDGYRDFLAGARFIENLANWLQQFEKADRENAYLFVRNYLVYLSPAEIQHLVELAYPETVQPFLVSSVAKFKDIQPYQVWSREETKALYKNFLRRCLFLGLSDGSRLDTFRRANAGIVSNEQIVLATQIDDDKWKDLHDDLIKDLNDESAKFLYVFLIDDFIASGKTLLRKENDIWKGKLVRFWKSVNKLGIVESAFDPDYIVCVHHYIASHKVSEEINERYQEALAETAGCGGLFPRVSFSFGTILPEDFPIDSEKVPEFAPIIDKYYDPRIESESIKIGGTDARFGFGGCALPLVLEHNTPNNSIALVWAESEDDDCEHSMRPLFRRRQRHT